MHFFKKKLDISTKQDSTEKRRSSGSDVANHVCVKCITLCKCLCSTSSSRFSASRTRNIGASHIWDFGPYHSVKIHVSCYPTSLSRQKTDSVVSKNNSSVRLGLSLKKSCLWSCVAGGNLYKLSILWLLITNYSSDYLSIYLFILSIYLFNYAPDGRSLLPKSTLPGWRLLLNLGTHFKWKHFCLIERDQANNQSKKQKIYGNSGGIAAYTAPWTHLQNTKNPFRCSGLKIRKKYQKIIALLIFVSF